jgi:gamma-glutamylcyclotransferase (GGCT)/AIG2-like uncharacterized protein YtfP
VAGTSLFVYGTLTNEAKLHSVTGRRFALRPATLEGWERILPERGYPYVVPRAGAKVEGFVVDQVDAESLAALDAYEDEGHLYTRRSVEVTADGQTLTCQVYVGNVSALRTQFG